MSDSSHRIPDQLCQYFSLMKLEKSLFLVGLGRAERAVPNETWGAEPSLTEAVGTVDEDKSKIWPREGTRCQPQLSLRLSTGALDGMGWNENHTGFGILFYF